jgi:hypothetical protein
MQENAIWLQRNTAAQSAERLRNLGRQNATIVNKETEIKKGEECWGKKKRRDKGNG